MLITGECYPQTRFTLKYYFEIKSSKNFFEQKFTEILDINHASFWNKIWTILQDEDKKNVKFNLFNIFQDSFKNWIFIIRLVWKTRTFLQGLNRNFVKKKLPFSKAFFFCWAAILYCISLSWVASKPRLVLLSAGLFQIVYMRQNSAILENFYILQFCRKYFWISANKSWQSMAFLWEMNHSFEANFDYFIRYPTFFGLFSKDFGFTKTQICTRHALSYLNWKQDGDFCTQKESTNDLHKHSLIFSKKLSFYILSQTVLL